MVVVPTWICSWMKWYWMSMCSHLSWCLVVFTNFEALSLSQILLTFFWIKPRSSSKFFNQMASVVALVIAMYSTSVDDKVVVFLLPTCPADHSPTQKKTIIWSWISYVCISFIIRIWVAVQRILYFLFFEHKWHIISTFEISENSLHNTSMFWARHEPSHDSYSIGNIRSCTYHSPHYTSHDSLVWYSLHEHPFFFYRKDYHPNYYMCVHCEWALLCVVIVHCTMYRSSLTTAMLT